MHIEKYAIAKIVIWFIRFGWVESVALALSVVLWRFWPTPIYESYNLQLARQ